FAAWASHQLSVLRGHHHPASITQFAMSPELAWLTSLVSGHFKRKRLAESARLPHAESNSGDHPDGANDHGRSTQAQPQSEANQKSQQRWQQIPDLLVLGAHEIAHQRRY